MPPRFPFRPVLAAMLAAAAPVLARADLVKTSPFMPPQSTTAAPSTNAPLQYMGWIQTGDGILYRIVDPAHKTGIYLKQGEKDTNLDVVIKQHDDDRDTVTVEHGGQTITLAEHEAKILAGASVPQMIPPPPMPPGANMAPGVTQSVVVNPTPADEQKRLEAVAAEVARRRALREQAAQQQQMQAGGPPPVAPMPPQQTRQDLQQSQQQQPQDQNQPGRNRMNRRNRQQ